MSSLAVFTTTARIDHHELLIDGRRVPAASGRYFETLNPATGRLLARVAEGDAADIDLAVRAARAALGGEWGRMRAADRGALLLRFAEAIRGAQDELIELESLDSGKPVAAIRRQDLPAVLDTLVYYAGMADKINGQVIPTRPDALTYTVREPLGVVGAIVPWNFPLMIGMWKIAPALACGCTVVLKPAEITPLTALRLGELALEAGFPPGVLNVVPGFGKTAGQALVDHPDVDKVTFTGSPAVGRQILRGAAGNLKRVTLELGGKSANIIFPDADIDAAAARRRSRASSSIPARSVRQAPDPGARGRLRRMSSIGSPRAPAQFVSAIRGRSPTGMGPLSPKPRWSASSTTSTIGRSEGAAVVTGGARHGRCRLFRHARPSLPT